uniref:Cytochrome P450 6k1-like n=1 Tax=Hirondellea gigas TaxID=1518452 RepID=A0A2P2I7R7_9CRUS
MFNASPIAWLAVPLLGVIAALLLALVVVYYRSCYSYWSMRGVGSPAPVWGIGNLYARLRPTLSMPEFDQWLYRDCGGSRFCGFYEFVQPVLMVGDPELLKHIMIRDFDHFCDRSFVTFNEPVMDHMLLGLKGKVWKRVRAVMTPTFSSGKVKQTLTLVNDCASNLMKYFNKQHDQGLSVYEMKDVYGRFTMDTIASIAFGVSSDSLNNTQDEFTAAAARFFAPPPLWRRPLQFLQLCVPQLAKLFGVNNLDRTPLRFFSKVVSDTMRYRLQHNLRRNDFLQLLLDASLQEKTNNNKNINSNNSSSSVNNSRENNNANNDSAKRNVVYNSVPNNNIDTESGQTIKRNESSRSGKDAVTAVSGDYIVSSKTVDCSARSEAFSSCSFPDNHENNSLDNLCDVSDTNNCNDTTSTSINVVVDNGIRSNTDTSTSNITGTNSIRSDANNSYSKWKFLKETDAQLDESSKSCDADKTADLQPVLTEEVITAQCVLFYMAGYDTTATTLSFVSYCLALHPGIQQRLMQEIEDVIEQCCPGDSAVTYEAIQQMTYLEMVFAETLRLYPPAPRVDRRCTKEYILPGTNVTIEVGTKITIPIYSIHRDSRYYPDPERFDPERFTSENKARRPQIVYMPFGSGPRNCIGKRFALMEAKIALVQLLQEFALLPCKKTQRPIALDRSSGLLKAQHGVWLRLAKRIAD